MPILMQCVKSSLLSHHHYDPGNTLLTVRFRSGGGIYQYADVTVEDWAQYMAAASKGSHFLKNVKTKFAYKKLTPEEANDYELEPEPHPAE